jgi:hypothetical protein
MASTRDDDECLHALAAEARDLMRQSKDERIVREVLAVMVGIYETLARRARDSSLLWLFCACRWLTDLADAVASV